MSMVCRLSLTAVFKFVNELVLIVIEYYFACSDVAILSLEPGRIQVIWLHRTEF